MDNGSIRQETSDRSRPQDGFHPVYATNLSRFAQQTFEPLSWQNYDQAQSTGFLDTSMGSLYGNEYPLLADAKVFEKAATQALEIMPPVSESIANAADASPFVLNVQITNVPEVSVAVSPDQWLNHVERAFAAGAEAVRPTENWLATRNSVHDSIIELGPILDTAVNYYANNNLQHIGNDISGMSAETASALNRYP